MCFPHKMQTSCKQQQLNSNRLPAVRIKLGNPHQCQYGWTSSSEVYIFEGDCRTRNLLPANDDSDSQQRHEQSFSIFFWLKRICLSPCLTDDMERDYCFSHLNSSTSKKSPGLDLFLLQVRGSSWWGTKESVVFWILAATEYLSSFFWPMLSQVLSQTYTERY